jgi:hypothetical protein
MGATHTFLPSGCAAVLATLPACLDSVLRCRTAAEEAPWGREDSDSSAEVRGLDTQLEKLNTLFMQHGQHLSNAGNRPSPLVVARLENVGRQGFKSAAP